MKRFYLLFISLLCMCSIASAQEWMKIHRHAFDADWVAPLQISKMSQYEFDSSHERLNAYAIGQNDTQMRVPFCIEEIDSISFANDLTDDEKGHDKYTVFTLHITTLDEAPILVKEEWIPCHFSLDGKGEYSDYSGTGRIRGRGNSTWEWYDKKPYKIKLDEKSKLLGLDKAKDWNLLANYRDVTDLMNAIAFEAARYMKMPNTNHTRFVEVFLNEEYIGLYQLTEKIEVDKNRIDIDKEGGVLLSFDEDDGPNLSPSATDNFWSKVYGLPMCIKHPDNPTNEQLKAIKADFAVLESAIKARDYDKVDSLMDVASFIHILQLHELFLNVELAAPRSLYMYRDKGGKYTFGPVWDWDAGFDFDWSTMMTGHNFFSNPYVLLLGSDPATQTNARGGYNPFFSDMFADRRFMQQYKDLWDEVSEDIIPHCWDEMDRYVAALNKGAYKRDFLAWPIKGKDVATEINKMKKWTMTRIDVVDDAVRHYPDGIDNTSDPSDEKSYEIVGNTIKVKQDVDKSRGYSQLTTIDIDEQDVIDLLGDDPVYFVPLNVDGSIGNNTAAKTYGAWFDSKGNTNQWASGHVYVESDNMYSLAFGCHPDNCSKGHTHVVTLLYGTYTNEVKLEITFNVK